MTCQCTSSFRASSVLTAPSVCCARNPDVTRHLAGRRWNVLAVSFSFLTLLFTLVVHSLPC